MHEKTGPPGILVSESNLQNFEGSLIIWFPKWQYTRLVIREIIILLSCIVPLKNWIKFQGWVNGYIYRHQNWQGGTLVMETAGILTLWWTDTDTWWKIEWWAKWNYTEHMIRGRMIGIRLTCQLKKIHAWQDEEDDWWILVTNYGRALRIAATVMGTIQH